MEKTVKQLTDEAIERLEQFRASLPMPAAREFSLAITALEDAQMRATRGLAMARGCFAPADLEADDA